MIMTRSKTKKAVDVPPEDSSLSEVEEVSKDPGNILEFALDRNSDCEYQSLIGKSFKAKVDCSSIKNYNTKESVLQQENISFNKNNILTAVKVINNGSEIWILAHNETAAVGYIHINILRNVDFFLAYEQSKKFKSFDFIWNRWIQIIFIAILAVVLSQTSNSSIDSNKNQDFEQNLKYLHQHKDIGIPLTNCLRSAKKQDGPCVMVILHSENGAKTAKNVAIEMAEVGELLSGKRFEVNGDNLSQYIETDTIVEFCNNNMTERKVLLIHNLQETEASIVKQFHSPCDRYNVKKDSSLIFIFTMLDTSSSKKGKSLEKARESMQNVWGNYLEDHELAPLITRLTDNVVYISN